MNFSMSLAFPVLLMNVSIDIPKYMSEKEEAEQKEETNEEE